MVSDTDGTVLLANLKMTQLARELTGRLSADAEGIINAVENAAADNYLVHTSEGGTWQFTKSAVSLNGKEYDQLTAVNMTDQYRITKELSEKNEHLKEVRYKMKSVAARERSLAAAREVMNARMTVHDRMGAVLLSGKYYLDHPENVKEEELLRLLEYNTRFLLVEAEQPEEDADAVRKAVQSAKRIGVEPEIIGAIPEDGTLRDLLAQAIVQCAANTVRHAGGDAMTVRVTSGETETAFTISNNGAAPDGPISETGGLAALRSEAEGRGAAMTVRGEPEFLLTISLPKRS